MNSQDNLKLTGKLNIVVTDEGGSIKDSRQVDNLVVAAGITHISNRIGNSSPPTAMSHMATGIGATAAAAGDTALGTERLRVALSSTTPNATNVQYQATFPANTTTIAAGSNGATLPQATINVASTNGFPSSGSFTVNISGSLQTITYTGVTATSFTGCTGGTGTLATAQVVAGTATFSLTEAGIFNAASAGTMLCRTVFPVINKGVNDTMTVTWTVNLVAQP